MTSRPESTITTAVRRSAPRHTNSATTGSSHGLGQTLALFRERITHRELPVVMQQIVWETLPADPRTPAAVRQRRQLRSPPGK